MNEKQDNMDLYATTADLTQIHIPPPLLPPSPPPRRAPEERTSTLKISRRQILKGVVAEQRAYLEISGIPGTEARIFQLRDTEVKIGRSEECDLHLALPNISRVHSRIYLQNEEHHVEDFNSTNGTFVNGVRISRCALRDNDLIEVGEAKIIFVEQKVRG